MSASVARTIRRPALPSLENGDRLTQAEFHRRYESYPGDVKFELIGGIVYMASPLGLLHSQYDEELGFALGLYRRATQGTEVLHAATLMLDEESEPQPDLGLRVLPEYGGRSRNVKNYIGGPPELVAEIAVSTRAIDMHAKRLDYQRTGVLEYLVVCAEEQSLHWFSFKPRRSLAADAQGIYRSRVFPGLWIDGPALLSRNSQRVMEIVQQGLASPEHTAFVKQLQAARKKK